MEEFRRIKRLPPYVFQVVNDLKMKLRRAGEDIIDLGMGNPDIPTPDHIVAKMVEAVQNPRNHRYSASAGIPKLRMAFADWWKRRHAVDLDPDLEVVATMGAKDALAHLVLATITPGDVVFAPSPNLSDSSILGGHRGRRSQACAHQHGSRLFRGSHYRGTSYVAFA